MVNKILQILKADHGVIISPKTEKLTELLAANISVLDDAVLNAIWGSLSPKISSQPSRTPKGSPGEANINENADGDKKGRYITYRGKKTWVED